MSAASAAIGDRVKVLTAAKTAERDAAYWQRVRECARPDAEPDPDKVAAWLVAEGYDAERFQADIERVAKRFEAKALLDRLPDVQAKRDRIQAEFDAAAAALGKAQEAFAAVTDRVSPQLKAIDAEINRGPAARSLLQRECPDTHLVALDREYGRTTLELQARRAGLYQARDAALGDAAASDGRAKDDRTTEGAAARSRDAAAARERAAGYAAEADSITRKMVAVQRERDALALEMQEP